MSDRDTRWIRRICRLYPTDFRALVEDDLVRRYVEERRRVRRARGRRAARRWALRTLADLIAGAVAERAGAVVETTTTGWRETMRGWWKDVSVAARSLVTRSPGFTTAAVLTFALGVGANTAVFSVVDGVLLRPLPYPDADRIVQILEVDGEERRMAVATPNFMDWREGSRTLEHVVARTNPAFATPSTVLGGSEPVRVRTSRVTEGFFEMMGVEPAVGRTFTPRDHGADVGASVVVSHGFWQRQMGGSRELGSMPLEIGGRSRTVVGVMPPAFDFPSSVDVWIPFALQSGGSRTSHNWLVNGRVREGADVATARAELARITADVRASYGGDMDAEAVDVRTLPDVLRGDLRQPLWLLLGAAGFVLLVACTNLVSTLLARGRERSRELAVRASLGASGIRMVRQLLTESALIALVGAGAGVALAVPLLEVILAAGPPILRANASLDLRVLAVTVTGGTVTALLFGLYPAVAATRTDLASALRQGDGRGSARRGPAWDVLVAGEVAMALVLLAGSVVLTRSFARVTAIEPGFDVAGVLTAEVSFPRSTYPDDPTRARGQTRILEALRSLPGVRAAGLVNHLPLGGAGFSGGFETPGSGDEVAGSADYRVASVGYFDAMGIPVLEGRTFEPSDDLSVDDVAVVSRSMAEQYWPDGSAVGRRIRNLRNDAYIYDGSRWITIVGVVDDVRHDGLVRTVQPTVYVHNLQRPARATSPVLVVATSGDAGALVSPVRQAVRRIDGALPLDFATMEARLGDSVAERRFTLLVLAAFAAVALGLAGVGIYGVVSYAVSRRTREMGIRLALGARPRGVLRMIVVGSLRTVALGAAVGTAGAVLMGRVLSGLVYEVAPTDPLSLAAAVTVLLSVGAAASFVPAVRAIRADPSRALRSE